MKKANGMPIECIQNTRLQWKIMNIIENSYSACHTMTLPETMVELVSNPLDKLKPNM